MKKKFVHFVLVMVCIFSQTIVMGSQAKAKPVQVINTENWIRDNEQVLKRGIKSYLDTFGDQMLNIEQTIYDYLYHSNNANMRSALFISGAIRSDIYDLNTFAALISTLISKEVYARRGLARLGPQESALRILGFESNERPSDNQIKQVYRSLALLWHSDKWKSDSEDALKAAEETFKKIQNAKEALETYNGPGVEADVVKRIIDAAKDKVAELRRADSTEKNREDNEKREKAEQEKMQKKEGAKSLEKEVEAERKAKVEAERKEREAAELRKKEAVAREAEARRAKEESDRKAKLEAERKEREEAELREKEAAAREEAEFKAKLEAIERRRKEERAAAELKAEKEAERKAKLEAERKEREAEARRAKEEAIRREREAEEARRAKEESDRKAQLEVADRKIKEEREVEAIMEKEVAEPEAKKTLSADADAEKMVTAALELAAML